MDGLQMIKSHTFAESVFLVAAARRAEELYQERAQQLAGMIRNELVQAWNKGQK